MSPINLIDGQPTVVKILAVLYADPGSGTLIWQLIAAAGFGLLFYSKIVIRKIRSIVAARGKGDEKDESKTL